MIDISHKSSTLRVATAQAEILLKKSTIELIRQGQVPKGDPLSTARVAAVQAAKNTSAIIPLCHPLPVEHVAVAFELGEASIEVTVTVKAIHKTGVEMEALTSATVAALTLYDMLKMLDDTMVICSVKLTKKTGGKSDFHDQYEPPLRAAVLVMSDSIAAGEKDDHSGRMIRDRLTQTDIEVVDYRVIPDDFETIVRTLKEYADKENLDLVLTTGGTGASSRDYSPEATIQVIEREIPGVSEAMRAYGQARTPYSMLSRGRAGIRGKTVIINLPGSKKGVADSLDALFPGILHIFKMLRGAGHAALLNRQFLDYGQL